MLFIPLRAQLYLALKVSLAREWGSDLGGLSRYVYSALLKLFEAGIEDSHNYFVHPIKGVAADDELLSPSAIAHRLRTFGVFTGEQHSLF